MDLEFHIIKVFNGQMHCDMAYSSWAEMVTFHIDKPEMSFRMACVNESVSECDKVSARLTKWTAVHVSRKMGDSIKSLFWDPLRGNGILHL